MISPWLSSQSVLKVAGAVPARAQFASSHVVQGTVGYGGHPRAGLVAQMPPHQAAAVVVVDHERRRVFFDTVTHVAMAAARNAQQTKSAEAKVGSDKFRRAQSARRGSPLYFDK